MTHQSNKAFLERVAKTPHTIVPDRLAASKKAVKIQTVGDKGQLTDGTRTIELHRLQGYEHTGDMLVVYLPKEKILAEPDAFTPPAQAGTPLIRAGRAVREGALRQHPAPEARRAGDRARSTATGRATWPSSRARPASARRTDDGVCELMENNP